MSAKDKFNPGSMVSALALTAMNMLGSPVMAEPVPAPPHAAAAPVGKDSLKADMLGSIAEFSRAAEAFGRDSLGLNLLVYDIDQLNSTPRPINALLPAKNGRIIPRTVTYESPHDIPRAENYRQDLVQKYKEKVQEQVEARGITDTQERVSLAAAADVMAQQVSQTIMQKTNSERSHKDENIKADIHTAGQASVPRLPEIFNQHFIDVQIVGINSALYPQLASAEEQLDRQQCTIPRAGPRHLEAMQRLHTAYHEIAHASSSTRMRDLPMLILTNDRDLANYNESVADGFAAAMLLRDFGSEAVPFLKSQAYGSGSYTNNGTDVDHYTAPITLAVVRAFENKEFDFNSRSPRQLLSEIEEGAKVLALHQDEPNLLQRYRAELEGGQKVDMSRLSPALQTYDTLHKEGGTLWRSFSQKFGDLTPSLPAGQEAAGAAFSNEASICHARLDAVLDQLADEQAQDRRAKPTKLNLGSSPTISAP